MQWGSWNSKRSRAKSTQPDPLGVLFSEQLGAVSFVQDYLQLDFEGHKLTMIIWPAVRIGLEQRTFGEPGYRDALCSLIGHSPTAIAENSRRIEIAFGLAGTLECDLSERPDDEGERVLFFHADGKQWSSW